jgi:hypothetical protein
MSTARETVASAPRCARNSSRRLSFDEARRGEFASRERSNSSRFAETIASLRCANHARNLWPLDRRRAAQRGSESLGEAGELRSIVRKAHFVRKCGRKSLKTIWFGRGGGDRTHDLRLKSAISHTTRTYSNRQEPMKSTREGNCFRLVSAAVLPGSRTFTRTFLSPKLDVTEFLGCELPNARLAENAGCDSSGKKHETRIGAGARLPPFCSQLRLSLYAPARELCSLAHRMQILLKYSLAQRRLDLDPVFEKNDSGHHRTCIRTPACKEDMRYFQRESSRLALTDLAAARIA